MRRVCLTLLVLLAACSTSSDYDPPVQRRPQERPQGMRQAATLLDVIPDDTWWRDNLIAAPLNLTTDQFQALDKIATDHHGEIAKLQRDLPIAARDLRDALDADSISATDINAATQRVRDIRFTLFDRQAEMLSAERLILTKDQWIMLTEELQRRHEEQQRMNRGGEGGRGGQPGQSGYPRSGRGRPW